ncbi:GBP1 [Symbiodinium pilosum]|uniref:GBP1 protein n=1 Tax=Symbiodinium pilosum TaxID=2952 RepID=A0A812QWX2_SYMPI|nr:GBP1 [Symbiodinium pilosum]
MAESDASYFSGPLQLIQIDDDGKCHLQENAAAILSQIPGRLAIVGIAGLYRTGKSFLLNRLLGLQAGFEIGPTINPCTKGLWIWGQPVQLAPDYFCILIDTEGLGSTQRTASCDMQILSLCILLSSYFIYNSMGAIDEQAIDDLHLVLHLAKHIHVKSRRRNEEEKSVDLAQYFPLFLWVLRDFHLRLADERPGTVPTQEYLERALQSVQGQDDKNKLRDVIKDLFRERDCATIVRPVADEADLRNIQKLPYESLRPEFRVQVEAFVKKVYMFLKPKKIDGQLVNGAMLVELAGEYCKAINGSVVPTIQSAWTSVVQHQLRLSLRDAVQVYRSRMNETAMQHLPVSDEKPPGLTAGVSWATRILTGCEVWSPGPSLPVPESHCFSGSREGRDRGAAGCASCTRRRRRRL